MAVRIKSMVVELPGKVQRTFDSDVTSLTVNEEQARSLYEQLSPVLEFFDSQVV